MGQRDGGYRGVSDRQRRAFSPIASLEEAGEPRDGPSQVVILQASQEFFCGGLFFLAHARIHFRHVDGTASQKVSSLDQAQEQIAPAALAVQSVDEDAGVNEVGSHLPPGGPMQPLFAFLAEFLHPSSGADLEFGVVLIFPRPSHAFQRLDLPKPSQFLLSSLGEKLAAPALADQSVNLAHERFGNDNVCAPVAHS
jgi:hypothetical protein